MRISKKLCVEIAKHYNLYLLSIARQVVIDNGLTNNYRINWPTVHAKIIKVLQEQRLFSTNAVVNIEIMRGENPYGVL